MSFNRVELKIITITRIMFNLHYGYFTHTTSGPPVLKLTPNLQRTALLKRRMCVLLHKYW